MGMSANFHVEESKKLSVTTMTLGESPSGRTNLAIRFRTGMDDIVVHTTNLADLERIAFEINAFVQEQIAAQEAAKPEYPNEMTFEEFTKATGHPEGAEPSNIGEDYSV